MIELLYGELGEAEASATRSHLEGCEACGDAWDRLSVGHAFATKMPLEEPPTDFRAVVMRAAREKAAERAPAEPAADPAGVGAAATSPREDSEEPGLWSSIVHWIGGIAMRPQMAMAMTLVLMVGIGLWYLPELRRHDPADTHAIVDPAPGDEVGPSASLVPAERLDLEADPHTGRIVPREDLAQAAPQRRQPATPEPEVTDEQEVDDGEPDQTLAAADSVPSERPSERAAAAEGAPEDERRSGEVIEEPMMELAQAPEAAGVEGTVGAGQVFGVQPTQRGATRPSQAPSRSSQAYAAQAETAPMPSAPPSPAQPQQAQAQGADASHRYRQGMDHYRGRRYREAAEEFDAVVRRPGADRSLVPSALHHLARSQRAAGDCRGAVRSYDNLLSRHGSYGGAPDAMIEAADCYRRLGQLSQARRLLERAAQNRAVASRAQRELAELSAAERAHQRAGQAQPAEAEAEAAAEAP